MEQSQRCRRVRLRRELYVTYIRSLDRLLISSQHPVIVYSLHSQHLSFITKRILVTLHQMQRPTTCAVWSRCCPTININMLKSGCSTPFRSNLTQPSVVGTLSHYFVLQYVDYSHLITLYTIITSNPINLFTIIVDQLEIWD
jgi:hypothetical protein